MNGNIMPVNRLSGRLGFWSALAVAVIFALWPVCFIAIFLTSPPFTWTGMEAFKVHVTTDGQFFQYMAYTILFLFCLLYVILVSCIHDAASPGKKILTRASLSFGSLFALSSCMNYFLQLSTVRLGLLKGQTSGLEQFIQSNPISADAAVNMLGWTAFLGLSSLFAAFSFSGRGLERALRYAFLANGVICITGGAAYILDRVLLTGLLMNLGMGGAVMLTAILLCIYFRKLLTYGK